MRFEGLDDLHVADATVLENDETELDDTLYILFLCDLGVLDVTAHIIEQRFFATGEDRHLLNDGVYFRSFFFLLDRYLVTTGALIVLEVVDVHTILGITGVVLRGNRDGRAVQFVLVFELLALIHLVHDLGHGECHRSANCNFLNLLLGFLFFLFHLGLLLLLLGFVLFEFGEFGDRLCIGPHAGVVSLFRSCVAEDQSRQSCDADEDINDSKEVTTAGF